jgi:prepilin-type processing-associated H-X9-DG protein
MGNPPTQICTEATKNIRYPVNTDKSAGIPLNDLYFHSSHPGGAQFCLADGSVQFLKQAIDIELYRDLATKSGGEVIRWEE